MKNLTQKYTNARLMAVQAVYAKELSGESWEKVMSSFLMGEAGGKVIQEGITGREEIIPLEPADAKLFTNLVNTVKEQDDILTQVIQTNISQKIDYDRLELILKCILKVGLAEFYVNSSLDAPIIINEYTDLTHAFFNGPEPKIINALLDKYAKILKD